jgi:putative membrane protein insertion efficiency factor
MRKLAGLLISAYQKYSSTRTPRCKYYPSCSNYAAVAIKRYGFKGLLMAGWRLLRCNPWSDGGVDYVDADLDSADALAKLSSTLVSDKATEGLTCSTSS